MRLPLRTTFDRPDEWPIAVSITLDDEPADRVVLATPPGTNASFDCPRPAADGFAGSIFDPIVRETTTMPCRWGKSRSALRGESAYTDTNAASDALNSTG
jgi:hypothetical protein